MKIKMPLIALAAVPLLACSCDWLPEPDTAEPEMLHRRFSQQWDEERVLENPYKGWYHHYYDNGIWNYGIGGDGIGTGDDLNPEEFAMLEEFPGMDHLYLRLAWSYLEPDEGQYDWRLIDEVVEKYVPLGYGISFRITCRETGAYPYAVGQNVDGINYATPKWVRDAGAAGTIIEEGENDSACSWAPDYGDAVFLEKLDNFHSAFAARYDHKPWVRYVDIGSIGDWGEGHTHFSTRLEVPNEVIRKHIDLHCKYYTRSRLVAVEGMLVYEKEIVEGATWGNERVMEIAGYALSKGIAFRSDSFLVDYYMRISKDTWSVTRPYLFEMMYPSGPVVYELEHYSYAKDEGHWIGPEGAVENSYGAPGATFMEKSMELSRASYIGFHGSVKSWLEDNPRFTSRIANRVGYWFFPVSATYPETVTRKSNPLTINWLNRGVAPSYNSFALKLHFQGEEQSFTVTLPDSYNTQWMPGQQHTAHYTFDIPLGIPDGDYEISAELYDESLDCRIEVGLAEKHLADGLIPIGRTTLIKPEYPLVIINQE